MLDLILSLSIKQTDLNSQLRTAVCRQEWRQAISIVDQMIQTNPRASESLTSYRSRLVNLSNSNDPTPSAVACDTSPTSTSNSTPTSTPPSATRTPQWFNAGNVGSVNIEIDVNSLRLEDENRLANIRANMGNNRTATGIITVNCSSQEFAWSIQSRALASQPLEPIRLNDTSRVFRDNVLNNMCN